MPEAFARIVDNTGIERKGTKSPGVQRQYTAGHGWEVQEADLRWFSDAAAGTDTCAELLYGP